MLIEGLSRRWFRMVHGRNLVYNTCWEDPRIDREALELGPDDTLLVITSAGCNALDYALDAPRRIHAVDMNFRQNALLELKQAAIRKLDYEPFFDLFGRGRVDDWSDLYISRLRRELSPGTRRFWDRQGKFFNPKGLRRSFYFHGSSGTFAWMINWYVDKVARVRPAVDEILDADSVEEQKAIFDRHDLRKRMLNPFIRWALRRDVTLALLGVPRSQRRQLDREYPGGIARFVRDRIETVFTELPLEDNYFWRVYLTGEYTPDCCPEYLKPDNFQRLKDGLVDRVDVHTDSILGFLEDHPGTISRFVLLDHMDWLYAQHRDVLGAEWQSIVDHAAPSTRILWRSAGLEVNFVDPIEVDVYGTKKQLGQMFRYHRELAESLHARDRVNTYGSFYVADLVLA